MSTSFLFPKHESAPFFQDMEKMNQLYKFLKMILGVSWRDRKTNSWVRTHTRCKDLTQTVKSSKWNWAGHLTLNGEAKPGEIVAIMGSSGSGKTTLLNVLNRKNCGSFKKFAKLSAYVQQDDLFYPTLTVKEHLKFQAALRMDRHIRHEERMSKVDKVIIDFGLKKCENTKIGGVLLQMVFKGISGGEKKRLAIASEVLTNPSVLFLDEPTSGLDSFMAESVIDSLINLARLGRTVICTIHQPSSQLFSKFDKLMLLSNGRVAFFGSLTDAEVFFSQCGLACPRLFNPADHYIYSLAVVPGDEERSKGAISCSWLEWSRMHCGFLFLSGAIANGYKLINPEVFHKNTSWCGQLKTLLHRSYLNTMRTPLVSAVRIMQSVMSALVVGVIYLQQKYDGKGIMNINGALFLTLTQLTFPYFFGVLSTFCPELPLFLREHWNGMYRTDTYFLAKNIAEVPGIVISVLIYGTISYWMIGLNLDLNAFLTFLAASVLIANVTTSFGYLISCAVSTPEMALSIGPPLLIPFMLFGGLFLNSEWVSNSVPVYLVWMKHLSWFNYGFEIMLVNEWSGVDKTREYVFMCYNIVTSLYVTS
ncbi:Protein white [Nymphon striatum]|nr:Protein white [Nymphon striatum]